MRSVLAGTRRGPGVERSLQEGSGGATSSASSWLQTTRVGPRMGEGQMVKRTVPNPGHGPGAKLGLSPLLSHVLLPTA